MNTIVSYMVRVRMHGMQFVLSSETVHDFDSAEFADNTVKRLRVHNPAVTNHGIKKSAVARRPPMYTARPLQKNKKEVEYMVTTDNHI